MRFVKKVGKANMAEFYVTWVKLIICPSAES